MAGAGTLLGAGTLYGLHKLLGKNASYSYEKVATELFRDPEVSIKLASVGTLEELIPHMKIAEEEKSKLLEDNHKEMARILAKILC